MGQTGEDSMTQDLENPGPMTKGNSSLENLCMSLPWVIKHHMLSRRHQLKICDNFSGFFPWGKMSGRMCLQLTWTTVSHANLGATSGMGTS